MAAIAAPTRVSPGVATFAASEATLMIDPRSVPPHRRKRGMHHVQRRQDDLIDALLHGLDRDRMQ
jgi:hypothetical protein